MKSFTLGQKKNIVKASMFIGILCFVLKIIETTYFAFKNALKPSDILPELITCLLMLPLLLVPIGGWLSLYKYKKEKSINNNNGTTKL